MGPIVGTLETLGSLCVDIGDIGFPYGDIGVCLWGRWGHMGPFMGTLGSHYGDIGVPWVSLWGHWVPIMGTLGSPYGDIGVT